MLIGGIFGHRHAADPFYVVWFHVIASWMGAHWQAIAVVIPILGAIVAGIINHYLAVARENRARRVSLKDLRARVYADLAARLLAHCSMLARTCLHGHPEPALWRRENAALRAHAQNGDATAALGTLYVSFMAAIDRERQIVDALDDSNCARGVHDTLKLYAPFIARFGELVQARRLEKHADSLLAQGGSR